jgi:hypothetical protein
MLNVLAAHQAILALGGPLALIVAIVAFAITRN